MQIALEAEGLKPDQRKKLASQEKKLLKKNARQWLGTLAPYLIDQKDFEASWRGPKGYEYKFARGLLDTISMQDFSLMFGHLLKNSTDCRTLRHLIIDQTPWVEEPVVIDGKSYGDESGIDTLVGAKFDNLRTFQLGEDDSNCHTQAGEGFTDIVKSMPRLENLTLMAHGVDTKKLFKMKMPNLKLLIVHHLTDYPIEILAKNKSMSKLETLKMNAHGLEPDDEDAYLRFEHIKAIGRSKNLGALKNLQLRGSDIGNPGIEEIIKSGLLGRLDVLDLQYGCVTDEGVDLLVEASEFSDLKSLNLNGNAITKAGVAKLKKSRVKFTATEQFNPETIDDEEREYLWFGDPE